MIFSQLAKQDDDIVFNSNQTPGHDREGADPEHVLSSLASLNISLSDPNLKKIYSMDSCCGLLSSGGGDGRVAIYGVGAAPQFRDEKDLLSPLLSFKAHSGWISAVKFVSAGARRSDYLLTSSNDTCVNLWDLSKQCIGTGVPLKLASANAIHRQGVFSLDSWADKFVTGSKDSTVALSVIKDGSIVTTRRFDNLHSGVVKSVHMRDENVFSSTGNDMLVQIVDTRTNDDGVITITNTSHNKVINSVRWNPSNGNMLSTTSFDETIDIWDMRQIKEPKFSLTGHCNGGSKKNKIYHPVFASSGTRLLTSGTGSEYLTVFSLTSGEVVSKGFVGFDTSALQIASECGYDKSETLVFAAHSQYISLFAG